jgi:hypothetical protein
MAAFVSPILSTFGLIVTDAGAKFMATLTSSFRCLVTESGGRLTLTMVVLGRLKSYGLCGIDPTFNGLVGIVPVLSPAPPCQQWVGSRMNSPDAGRVRRLLALW